MPCASASWPERAGALAAKRTVKRVYNANTNIYLCPQCDNFHISVEVGAYPINEKWRQILRCLAQGMTSNEIAGEVGLTVRSVEDAIWKMTSRFYALNRPHLVSIAIALGLVNPNDFVPQIKEKAHAD